jgi:peroxiredoxin
MRQLREFAERIGDFKKLGVKVVAITVDEPQQSKKVFREVAQGKIRILSDPGAEIIEKYGLLHAKGRNDDDIAIRATVLLDSEGRELWRRVSTTAQETPSADEILDRIRSSQTKPKNKN